MSAAPQSSPEPEPLTGLLVGSQRFEVSGRKKLQTYLASFREVTANADFAYGL